MTNVTDGQIADLGREAMIHGDYAQSALADLALGRDLRELWAHLDAATRRRVERYYTTAARAECERVIAEARAQE